MTLLFCYSGFAAEFEFVSYLMKFVLNDPGIFLFTTVKLLWNDLYCIV